ncbi:MAG TPA: hypothetical protein VN213_21485 [Solirubrobacteraceae bacterium]|nr:hypothetical protein [Solirubrobacteraceae bacterium]
MTTIKTRRWPWFALSAALAVLGIVVLDGGVAGVVSLAAFLTLFGACMRGLVIDAREDPERVRQLSRIGVIGW